MPVHYRAVLGVAFLVLAVAGTAFYFRDSSSGVAGQPPTASPSPAAPSPSPSVNAVQASADPADWPRYTSEQHGFTIGYPPDWTLRKAYRPWSFEEDGNDLMLSAGADGFVSGDEYLIVNAWRAPLADGQSGDEWLAALLARETCEPPADGTRPIRIDGRPGVIVTICDAALAVVYTEDGAFAFGVWRPDFEPLLEEFVSTVDLP